MSDLRADDLPQKDGKQPKNKVRPTSLSFLLLLVLITLISSFFFVDSWILSGNMPFMTPIWSFAVPLCIAGFVLWQGWLVRAYQARKRAIDPLRAGRIWLLSQAASRTGAVMLGLMCGVVCSYARQGTTAFLSTQILHFSLASFGSALLLFSGWLAERWCIVHFSDDDSGASSSGLRAESAPI